MIHEKLTEPEIWQYLIRLALNERFTIVMIQARYETYRVNWAIDDYGYWQILRHTKAGNVIYGLTELGIKAIAEMPQDVGANWFPLPIDIERAKNRLSDEIPKYLNAPE